MSDYKKISDIVAGVGNATQLRSNSKTDEGTDTVTGVDWFTYNSRVCSSIYANGNSWIGLGSSSEHLKVNRRDAAMWNLWREEGTYLNYYKFLRIRWSGYAAYKYTSTSYLLTYDVVLFDTGDIMLYVVDIPKSSYTGTFTLGSLSYTKPTADNRYVTFYLQEDGSYIVDYAPISLANPYMTKYLVRDNNTIYTVSDNTLVEVSGEINSNLFIDNGVDDIPDGTLLMTLSNPEVLCWTDGFTVPLLNATVQGIPPQPQIIVSEKINLMDSSIKGIESVAIDCKGEPVFAVSFDKKATWIMHNGTEWVAVSDEVTGMTKTEFEAITTEQWQAQYEVSSDMYIRCTLLDETQSVTTVSVGFVN